MIALFRLSFRNALRNGRRTLLTAATVMIGTAFVVITLSFMQGIFEGMITSWLEVNGPVRIVTTEYAEREQLRPLHANIAESDPVVAKLAAIEGVAMAAPTIRTGVLVSIGEELGEDGAMLMGSTPDFYEQHILPDATFSAGEWLDYGATDEQVVLGGKVARDTGAKVGDEILLMGTTQYGSMAPISAKVVGVISGNSAIDAQAYVTLEIARWMIDVPDGALEILVYPTFSGQDRAALARVSDDVREQLGDGYAVIPWFENAMWVQMLPITDSINVLFSMVIIFVMALAIFNTMTMSVLERTGEIGVMRAMGQSRSGAVGSFLAEALMIGLLGGGLGALLGAGPALYLESTGLSYSADVLDEMGGEYALSTVMYGDLTPGILAIALVVGVTTALLGAALPSIRAANIPPFEAMRQR